MKILSLLFLVILNTSAFAEKTPFTYIEFGQFPGRGEFIQIENSDFLNDNMTNLLLAVNGVSTQEIINQTRARYGEAFRCRIAEHFTETLTELGIPFDEAVDLRVYLLDGGHQVIELTGIPLTEDNFLTVQFETNFCL